MDIDWNNETTWVALIVDDEPDNLELLSDVLQYYGVQVVSATSGPNALQILQNFEPNLIILDLGMPEMNGWELRLLIRQQARFASVPVVALSAHAMVGDKERVLEAGFDGYLSKPISVGTIINDIRGAINPTPH
jgi:two-component system cell cycle response regulator DivK